MNAPKPCYINTLCPHPPLKQCSVYRRPTTGMSMQVGSILLLQPQLQQPPTAPTSTATPRRPQTRPRHPQQLPLLCHLHHQQAVNHRLAHQLPPTPPIPPATLLRPLQCQQHQPLLLPLLCPLPFSLPFKARPNWQKHQNQQQAAAVLKRLSVASLQMQCQLQMVPQSHRQAPWLQHQHPMDNHQEHSPLP